LETNDVDNLNTHHRTELEQDSSIDPQVIAERGYATVGRPNASLRDASGRDTREQLKAMGFPSWATREDYYYPGLHIPQYTPSGTKYAGQFKPFRAVPNREGKPQRYASSKGPSRLDVHPRWSVLGHEVLPPILDPNRRLWITEGVKKADSLTSRGEVTVALAGVYSWRNTHASLGDWEDVQLKGREIVVCFDADAREKPHVAAAMERLGRWLKHKGSAKVWYVLPPGGPKGVDDYFATGGTLPALLAARTTTPPTVLSAEDAFTDSALADMVAAAVLLDQYCRTTALGWLRWDGRVWTAADSGEVVETIRQYFREQYADALRQDAQDVATGKNPSAGRSEGWRKCQSAGRISAVLSLAGNIDGVLRDAGLFDTDPDLLNTPSGVVDLRTGEVTEHSPDLLCTKITGVGYRPGAESSTWKTALDAVPAEALDWLHLRLGQSATGYQTDDGKLVLLTGGGNNGKTVLLGAVFRALGGGSNGRGYAAKVPNTLLLKGKSIGGPTPEKMTLRGTRMAYLEETPEEGYLDANVVKEIMDAEVIEGRRLYKDTVEWTPTHSIFLNTNHAPVVTDTGDGTWRRLLRLDFPYRYRVNGDPLERPTDRVGDPVLKAAMGTTETQEAVLAWLVAGAIRWYGQGMSLSAAGGDPAVVRESVQRWREDSDDILRFAGLRLVFDAEGWVSSEVLYREFREWALTNGHKPMSSKEFAKRLRDHGALPAYVEAKTVRVTRAGHSQPAGWPPATFTASTIKAIVGIRFGH
jgi:putative DNA primase/helicase